MTTFYLVRHGEKELGKGDPQLSVIGQQQALKVSKYLAQFPIAAIYASPSLRTQQTAQTIASEVRIAVMTDMRLRERINWELPRQTFEEFVILWRQASADPLFVPTGGDSVAQTAKRFYGALHEISLKYPNDHIVIVSHSGAIRDFFYMYKKEVIEDLLAKKGEIGECSVSKVQMDGNTLEVESVNIIEHLS